MIEVAWRRSTAPGFWLVFMAVVTLAAAAVLWIVAGTSDAKHQTAWVGAGATLTVAGLGSLANWLSSVRTTRIQDIQAQHAALRAVVGATSTYNSRREDSHEHWKAQQSLGEGVVGYESSRVLLRTSMQRAQEARNSLDQALDLAEAVVPETNPASTALRNLRAAFNKIPLAPSADVERVSADEIREEAHRGLSGR